MGACCCGPREPLETIEIRDQLQQICKCYLNLELSCGFMAIFESTKDTKQKLNLIYQLTMDELNKVIIEEEEKNPLLMGNVSPESELNSVDIGDAVGSLQHSTNTLIDILNKAKVLHAMSSNNLNNTIHIKGSQQIFSYFAISKKFCLVTYASTLNQINTDYLARFDCYKLDQAIKFNILEISKIFAKRKQRAQ